MLAIKNKLHYVIVFITKLQKLSIYKAVKVVYRSVISLKRDWVKSDFTGICPFDIERHLYHPHLLL